MPHHSMHTISPLNSRFRHMSISLHWLKRTAHSPAALMMLMLMQALCSQLPLANQAHAQGATVYRCEGEHGGVTYSQHVCGVQAHSQTVGDDRNAKQVQEALQVREREISLANRMVREQKHRERMGGEIKAKPLTVARAPAKAKAKSKRAQPDPHAPVPFVTHERTRHQRPLMVVVPPKASPQPTNQP